MAETSPSDGAPTGGLRPAALPGVRHAEDEALAAIPAAEATRYEAEQRDLERWWAEMERRVLAGEFDERCPDPLPDEELLRWFEQDDPPPGHWPVGSPPDLDPPPDVDPPADPDRSPHPHADRSAGSVVGGDGWWTRADRAVEAAGTALLATEQALGHAHRLVATAARADAVDEAGWACSAAGRVTAAPDALTALAAVTEEAREALTDLLGRTGGGGLAERPRLVLSDALTGALVALTDLPGLHRAAAAGTGLAPPGPTDGYHPGTALDRHARARDRRCSFPGCRRRAGHLDHSIPWPAGPTAAANLTGYCAGHHRGKHQAPGWRHTLAPDGTLTVTTPTGLTAVTTPPPY